MLLTREEMTFDFCGARLEPVRDRNVIGWMLNQFLYGEVTGIQIGHWLFDAPDVESARFLSRQAVEEFQHVDNFLRIMGMLGCSPEQPHWIVRHLATGMMGSSWAEHVALEMAAGEGFVLMAFYGVIDTLDHGPSVEILERAVRQEERHVDFGEQQTRKLIEKHPYMRRHVLGLSLAWMAGVRLVGRAIQRKLPQDHPLLSQVPAFVDKALACSELRLRRIGILDRPLAEISAAGRAALIAEAYAYKAVTGVGRLLLLPVRLIPGLGRRRLTETYLADPAIRVLPPAPEADGAGPDVESGGETRQSRPTPAK